MNNQSVSFIVIYFVVLTTPDEGNHFIDRYLSSVQSQDDITEEAGNDAESDTSPLLTDYGALQQGKLNGCNE